MNRKEQHISQTVPEEQDIERLLRKARNNLLPTDETNTSIERIKTEERQIEENLKQAKKNLGIE